VLGLRLLGEIEVLRDGAREALPPSRKTRALLAFLAATGKPHRRERLCTMFWNLPADPRGSLRWSLSRLRALVDEPDAPRIVATRDTVAFEPRGADVDLLVIRERVANFPALSLLQNGRGALRVLRGIQAIPSMPVLDKALCKQLLYS